MNAVVAVGIEVTPAALHAVAIDARGEAVGRCHDGGVVTRDRLAPALRRLVAALGPLDVPVGLAWADGRRGGRAVDLTTASAGQVAGHLRRWTEAGIDRVTVVTDDRGGRWAVPVRPVPDVDAAVRDAAARARLRMLASEPADATRARRPRVTAAHGIALVAAGLLTPATHLACPPPPAAVIEPVWVVERVSDGAGAAPGSRPVGSRRRWTRMLRRRLGLPPSRH